MDSDQYLPITTIANLEQIQELTTDLQLVVQLLRGKSQLVDASPHTLFNFFNCYWISLKVLLYLDVEIL